MPPRVGRVAIDRDLEHSHANTRYRRYARVVGLAAVFFGRQQAVARHFGCSIDFVRYHSTAAKRSILRIMLGDGVAHKGLHGSLLKPLLFWNQSSGRRCALIRFALPLRLCLRCGRMGSR